MYLRWWKHELTDQMETFSEANIFPPPRPTHQACSGVELGPASPGGTRAIWSFWKTQLPNLNFFPKLGYVRVLSWSILLIISPIFLFTSDFKCWFPLVFIATPVVSPSVRGMFEDEDVFTEAGEIAEIYQQAVDSGEMEPEGNRTLFSWLFFSLQGEGDHWSISIYVSSLSGIQTQSVSIYWHPHCGPDSILGTGDTMKEQNQMWSPTSWSSVGRERD